MTYPSVPIIPLSIIPLDHLSAFPSELGRQLPNGRCLSRSVDPHNEDHGGLPAERELAAPPPAL